MMHDRGLRRGEVSGLDLQHVEFGEDGRPKAVAILGKGESDRIRLSIPGPTVEALEAWIAVRGSWPGPLFTPLDEPGSRRRLAGGGIAKIVNRLGVDAGLSRRLAPHALRHQAITEALDRTGGDIRKTQRFSRHVLVQTVMVYDDNRRDESGDVAALVADDG
jgi:integrase/recombinase XerC